MCGIFGYIGSDNNAVLKAVRGITDLEYRGYDSWGVIVKDGESFASKKEIGKVSAVDESAFSTMTGCCALGHTRWATHGVVHPRNAHPHFNTDKTLAVVLNGIIENHRELRNEISTFYGHDVFLSQTDAEVIPHLIDIYLQKGVSLERAVRQASRRLKGRYAFVVVEKKSKTIFAGRHGSPLVVGIGEDGYYIASDPPAFLDYTNKAVFLDDGEYLKTDGTMISYARIADGAPRKKKITVIEGDKIRASKGGFDHFMLKEILEQPQMLLRALRQDDDNLEKGAKMIDRAKNVVCTACGTAGNVCLLGEYYFAHIAKKRLLFTPASEFEKELPFIDKKSLVLTVTQSGETADVLEVVGKVQERGARVASILNVRGSTMERMADLFFPINVCVEKAVASTKAATGQVVVMILLAYTLAGGLTKGKRLLKRAIAAITEWLNKKTLQHIKRVARRVVDRDDMYVIGNAYNYPVALEAALKIKEVSYIHTEGFAAGELKHGPIALIEKGTPCIVLVSEDEHKDDILSSTEELKARGALIIGVAVENNPLFDRWIPVPHIGVAQPLAHLIATQLLAYYLATLRGIDPDMPRNLAKSVTVK